MQSISFINDLLNYDFCPKANRWVYWMKNPVWIVLVASVIALLIAVFVNSYGYICFGILVGVALLGTVWPKIAMAGISCSLTPSTKRVREGEHVEMTLAITNRWPWPVWGLSLQRGYVVWGHESEGMALACVGGWSEAEYRWDFLAVQRGEYPTQLPQLETSFPFGLSTGQCLVEVTSSLIVWPRSVALNAMPDTVEIQPREERFSDRRAGDFGDILGTRTFRRGDPLRRIHWAQTARYRQLIVTERQAPATCALEVVLDVDAKNHHVERPDESTLEQAIAVAASLVESLHRQHASVECLIGNDRHKIGASLHDLNRFLDSLARIPASGVVRDQADCQFDSPSRSLPRMTVTTPLAFHHHMNHHHDSTNGRFILVNPIADADDCEGAHHGDCHCESLLEVRADDDLVTVLPERWRAACHVA